MFVNAIKNVLEYTRPIHSISRTYGSKQVFPGSATLFFVNQDGWALTCKHVAEVLVQSEMIETQYKRFQEDRRALDINNIGEFKKLEIRYGYEPGVTVEIKNNFINCVESLHGLQIVAHPTLDLALIHFANAKILCPSFAKFGKDANFLQPGRTLCRVGFPFPEFENFRYNENRDEIEWTQQGRPHSPNFPIEGMLTRMMAQNHQGEDKVIGFELSTPGLRGQSGGPVFDLNGVVWGIQSFTGHLPLGFEIQIEIQQSGRKQTQRDNAYLHVGRCIHIDLIKSFLRDHKVEFTEI